MGQTVGARQLKAGLHDPSREHSSCGVGFITRKDSVQTHDVLLKAHEALCVIPHRGGMSYEGIGDGAGVSLDLSVNFFRKVTGRSDLAAGTFGVGNFFLPDDRAMHEPARQLVTDALAAEGLALLTRRDVPVNDVAIRPAARAHQLPIWQAVFAKGPEHDSPRAFDAAIYRALLAIEERAYTDPALNGLYPLSLSARTQVYKGRFNSGELIPYFPDLTDPDHQIHTIFFHTRFSTNTAPHPIMAQPFRVLAHNGELNTDKKNRLSEFAIAQMKGRTIYTPKGQSDSARLDQTLARRLVEDELDIVTAVVAMMPPAWENDTSLSPAVRDMLEYFSLYEEKNDGPAALVFGNGEVVGARLDRLGLRPLRTVETATWLCVTSEAGQIHFPPEDIIRRGRIAAGDMIHFDHRTQTVHFGRETLETLAAAQDYGKVLADARLTLADLPDADPAETPARNFTPPQLYVACALNQETFRFFLDPMLETASEKVSAMGYGTAINALSDQEGGLAKYLSQRFAQVTNPPLDSLKEADGMTLRVALGPKPSFTESGNRQIVIETPILSRDDFARLHSQQIVPVARIDCTYRPIYGDPAANGKAILARIEEITTEAAEHVRAGAGLLILSDLAMDETRAPLPGLFSITAVNNCLIKQGLRFSASLVFETGQIGSSHHLAVTLGFGASAIAPVSVWLRAEELFPEDPDAAITRFVKAAGKSLMKTMGKVGLCTVESYIGGEFFEPSFLNTNDPDLVRFFPNMVSPVGGVGFTTMAGSSAAWHQRATQIRESGDIPILGLFKERAEGAGHSYGIAAVRGFVELTEATPPIKTGDKTADTDALRLLTVRNLDDAYGMSAEDYAHTGFDMMSAEEINRTRISRRYENFMHTIQEERRARPAALRDVLCFPADVTFCHTREDFLNVLGHFDLRGNESFLVRGIDCQNIGFGEFRLRLSGARNTEYRRLTELKLAFEDFFAGDMENSEIVRDRIDFKLVPASLGHHFLSRLEPAPGKLSLSEVEPASEICKSFASGAMSHGALVAEAHEAVAHGFNIVGGFSNCGEGGENLSRFGTIRASRIKQLASGRFGVWTGYLADPMLEELEIKIAQGAKPGEGGQLPGPKVTVDIAAARGGTPGVELISPPPHHDTYSIEDLAQLIHDAKTAGVRVIVKLVSSEGIGTIAVGVAKAGADIINIAGNTGGTGAAAVTSLKNTGRAAEIGIAEVHQALCHNGIREKVKLRVSGAHQLASDIVKSALLGADSFEFGTTALMMLKCVMAKNCNIKCPAGLTTNPEVYDGDPRALAQYLVMTAHEVRSLLANIGLPSLEAARGRSDLLHLVNHASNIGNIDLREMLHRVDEPHTENPVAVEGEFPFDEEVIDTVKRMLLAGNTRIELGGSGFELDNTHKSVGGRLSIKIERWLNHEISDEDAARIAPLFRREDGRRFLDLDTVLFESRASAGQSYGAFGVDGITFRHTGTCNDGTGKGLSGADIIVRSPGGGGTSEGENVLIGNFALFGAMGGRLFVGGEAGDRFAVRNSGAVAIVEGLGDFGCEYMTNGTVVNLGGFGKGFCNGMSGGFAYQYDPEDRLDLAYSRDSVRLFRLDDVDDPDGLHRAALKRLIETHQSLTDSALAARLLENWEETLSQFRGARAIALDALQDTDSILKATPRKAMIEELATSLCQRQLRDYKLAYRDGVPLLGGAVPQGEANADKLHALLNSYAVQQMAQQLAMTRLGGEFDAGSPEVAAGMHKLILTEDFALRQQLMKYARSALGHYEDTDLAVLVAAKRLGDYKRALSKRDVMSMHSDSTYGWLMKCDRRIREKLAALPDYAERFAREATNDIARLAG